MIRISTINLLKSSQLFQVYGTTNIGANTEEVVGCTSWVVREETMGGKVNWLQLGLGDHLYPVPEEMISELERAYSAHSLAVDGKVDSDDRPASIKSILGEKDVYSQRGLDTAPVTRNIPTEEVWEDDDLPVCQHCDSSDGMIHYNDTFYCTDCQEIYYQQNIAKKQKA